MRRSISNKVKQVGVGAVAAVAAAAALGIVGCGEPPPDVGEGLSSALTSSVTKFVTPNQCHDMHGQTGCANSNTIRAGDDWLAANLPALISFANAHAGVIFIAWDEGSATTVLPFLAVGPHIKTGFTGTVTYTHSSIVKSIEHILELPTLSTVASANELSNLFVAGFYP